MLFRSVYLFYPNSNKWSYLGLYNSPLLNNYIYTVLSNDSIIIAGSNHGIFYSHNSGETWILTNFLYDNIESLFKNSRGTILAGGWDHIYYSQDTGVNWRVATGIFQATTTPIQGFIENDGRVFAVAKDWMCHDGGIYYSEDDGRTWHLSGLKNLYVEEIGKNRNGDLYVSTFGCGFFISRDNGESWLQKNYLIPTRGMVVDSTGRIWVGANELTKKIQGVYYTDNEGESWNPANDGLQNNLLTDLFLSSNHYLYAICSHSSLSRMKIASSTPPIEFYSKTLVWPNPVKDIVHLVFPNALKREILLYSAHGSVYWQGQSSQITYTINLSGLPSGFYFCKMICNGKTECLKINKK